MVDSNRQFPGTGQCRFRPNYENRDNKETRITPGGELLGTLFEENIRDQDRQSISTKWYGIGPHRHS